MNKEENVCAKETQTGQVAEAKKEVGPTVLGKFKDVNALLEAYGALEAEFTRRSQRLKALEREVENSKKSQGSEAEKLCLERVDAEKGEPEEEPIAAKSLDEEDVDKKAALNTEVDGTFTDEDAKEDADDATDEADRAEAEKKPSEPTSLPMMKHMAKIDEDELYKAASGNESVRLKIVGDYLLSLGRVDAPLSVRGMGAPVLAPKKAKSVEDAGAMALRYFKSGGEA